MSGETQTASTEQTVQTGATGTPTIPKDPPTFDRAAVESKVSDRLAAAFGGDEDGGTTDDVIETPAEELPAAEETTTEEQQTTAETTETTEEQQAGEEQPATETQTEDAGAAAKTTNTAPTLPAAYRRSLKAYEWTDEEIDANLKTLGTKFIETAGRIHKNRNVEIADWAERGRQSRTQSAQQQQTQAPQQQQSTEATGLKPVDAAALKKQYGADELIDAIVGPVNATIEQINKMLPAVQQTQARSQQAEIEMFSRQVDGFFGGKELEPYTSVYGNPAKAKLSSEQIVTRNKVLETADALMAGAMQATGRSLSFGEAMQLAHDSVSSGFKEQAVRTQIKSQLKTRNKGITLKPASRNNTAASAKAGGAPKTRSDLERKVSQGLAAAFN